MIKICVKCSNENQEECNFCIHCGYSFVEKCESCIFIEGYCNDCGKKEEIFSLIEEINSYLACVSDIGRRHSTNQDYVAVKKLEDGTVLMVVADGVSTASNSEEAAKLAVENAIEQLVKNHDDILAIKAAINSSHNQVISLDYVETPELVEPMCTIVVAVIKNQNLLVGWVGDSRAYLFNDKVAEQLTRDDSWVSDVMDKGISEVEALKSVHAHEITQCLGTRDETPVVRLLQKKLSAGDVVLLCSDGLWNYFTCTEDIKKFIGNDTVSMCKKLVSYANICGGSDNISVAIHILD